MATRSHWSTVTKAIQQKTGGSWKDAVNTYRSIRAERGAPLSVHYLRTASARVVLKGVKTANQPKLTGQKPAPIKPVGKKGLEFKPLPPIRDKWKPPELPKGTQRKYSSHPMYRGFESRILDNRTIQQLMFSLLDTTIGRDLRKLPLSYSLRMGRLMVKIGEALERRGFIPDALRRKLLALIKAMGKKLKKAYTDNEFYQGMKAFYG